MAHQEDLELAQKVHGAELSNSPSESPPSHTFLQREETNNSTGLHALSKVLGEKLNPLMRWKLCSESNQVTRINSSCCLGPSKHLGVPGPM